MKCLLTILLILFFSSIFLLSSGVLVGAQSNSVDVSAIVPGCGDNIAEGNEQCDGSDFAGQTCNSLGFSEGVLACNSDCTLDADQCYNTVQGCGNNMREGNEQCDGSNLGGQTCDSLGFAGGTLACGSGCTFDTSGCNNNVLTPPGGGETGSLSGGSRTGQNNLTLPPLVLPAEPIAPSGGFKIAIDGGASETNNQIVSLALFGGPDTTQVEISDNNDFSGATLQTFQQTKLFFLSPGDGLKNIFVKFFSENGNSSPVISGNIVLNTKLPVLTVSQLKILYSPAEDVIISGTTDPNLEVVFSWDDKYGSTTADKSGNWSANFGKMPSGTHSLNISAKNDAGNIKNETADISVGQEQPTQQIQPVQPGRFPQAAIRPENNIKNPVGVPSPSSNQPSTSKSLINKVKDNVVLQLESIFQNKQNPQPVVSIPKETPQVLKGKWQLVVVNTGFVKFFNGTIPAK